LRSHNDEVSRPSALDNSVCLGLGWTPFQTSTGNMYVQMPRLLTSHNDEVAKAFGFGDLTMMRFHGIRLLTTRVA
jgi:hypothetical protein